VTIAICTVDFGGDVVARHETSEISANGVTSDNIGGKVCLCPQNIVFILALSGGRIAVSSRFAYMVLGCDLRKDSEAEVNNAEYGTCTGRMIVSSGIG
jgi:hypothetical protein